MFNYNFQRKASLLYRKKYDKYTDMNYKIQTNDINNPRRIINRSFS